MTSRRSLTQLQRAACAISGCAGRVVARGWCDIHYRRWKKYGDPKKTVKTPNGEPRRFYDETVLAHPRGECLFWPYNRNSGGYGMLYDAATRSHVFVHRLACESANGPPPSPKHHAAHSCGNGSKGCVSPWHLSWKTPKENHADKILHGTANRGEANYAAKLTDADVREIRRLAGRMPQSKIGQIFGIEQTTVSGIVRRESWAHVK